MDPGPIYVIALESDAAFTDWVEERKREVLERAGPQVYLDHPVHLTLYVAALGPSDPRPLVAELAGSLVAPKTVMDRWHVFTADQLTGNHTLVCDVPRQSAAAFEQIQRRTVELLSPLRDRQACCNRYASAWERLSKEERGNIERFGFPFVGPIWHAHVTIASIRTNDWESVEPMLREAPPSTSVCFDHLAIYVLEHGNPRLVDRFKLVGVTAASEPPE